MSAGSSSVWSYLAGQPWIMVALGLGLAAFCVTLVALLFTRWGHQPLRKCLLLSLLAHGLFAGYATTVQIFSFTPKPREVIVKISLVDGSADPDAANTAPAVVEGKATSGQAMLSEVRPESAKRPAEVKKPPVKQVAADKPTEKSVEKKVEKTTEKIATSKPVTPPLTKSPPALNKAEVAKPQAAIVSAPAKTTVPKVASSQDWTVAPVAPKYAKRVDNPPGMLETITPVNPLRTPTTDAVIAASVDANIAPSLDTPPAPATPLPVAVPNTYRLRLAADHLPAVLAAGGSADTEAAVKAALHWFAANQAADGRWSARQHGAGREATPDRVYRANAGIEADTGMTGLALLTLLASGNTHRQGQYQEAVRRGCNFLISQQNDKGSLAGSADRFAAMYSHAIATFALSEDYGMTHDSELDAPVRRAISYTVGAQDAFGGGWRYLPGDAGDTSQLGWQFMALKSADLAGIPLSTQTRQGITRYLNSVTSGEHGGLAAYRPSEPPSRTMTAEALVCWQFLGLAHDHPAGTEAANYLLEALPSDGQPNYYYWYYGTMATFQLRGEPWRKWNAAVATRLVHLQQKDGPRAGAWEPDAIWGGYGGRIYSTALATLCLEVYYRYLPVYGQQ